MVNYVCEGFGKIVGENGGGGGAYQWCGLWGYRNDWDAGLMHIGARYYEVETGRWIQMDRICNVKEPQTLNPYSYCSNQPINNIDPLGHSDFPLWKVCKVIIETIVKKFLPEMPYPLPPWKPPFKIDWPPWKWISPPYPITAGPAAGLATKVFTIVAEWGAETFWGPPEGPRPNENIIISPIEALIAKRSGLTAEDLGL